MPETLRADDLLAEMRRRGVREALVIDEYGGTAGLVTFESLMERIVGDLGGIRGRRRASHVLPDGSADIDGLALVDRRQRAVRPRTSTRTTYTTVGGYVLGRLGRRAARRRRRRRRRADDAGRRARRPARGAGWLSAPQAAAARQRMGTRRPELRARWPGLTGLGPRASSAPSAFAFSAEPLALSLALLCPYASAASASYTFW